MKIVNMRQRLLPLFVAGLSVCASCATPELWAEARYGWMKVDGDLGVQAGGSVSATSSLDSLGLDDSESAIGGRIDLTFGSPHLTIIGWSTKFEGDGTAQATISQGGTVITAGTPVESSLDYGAYSALLTFDLFPGDTFDLGIGVGATYLDVDASIEDQTVNQQVSTDEQLPVPVLAAEASVDLFDRLQLSVLAAGVYFEYSGDQVTYVDVDANLKFRLFDMTGFAGYITGGYRFAVLDLEYDDSNGAVDVDADFSGPYVGLAVSF